MAREGTASVVRSAIGRLSLWSDRAGQRARGVRIRSENRRRGGRPIPPSRLLYAVAGSDDVDWFLSSGADAANGIRAAVARHGVVLEDCPAVLDFGCGVGRVLRHWANVEGPTFLGVDYNPDHAAWCRENLPFARVQQNQLDGRLPYADGSVRLAYALSVFTHLTLERQAHWMGELHRVLEPGGLLLFTTHGDYYARRLPPPERARYDAGEMLVLHGRRDGSNHCVTYHPEPYVRSDLARDFEVAEWIPQGAWGLPGHDVYIVRKPR